MIRGEVIFEELEEFKKEMKKLSKKYPSLDKDFGILKSALAVDPTAHILIEGLGGNLEGIFYKVKKFRCQSIAKNSVKSGIRIIYRYLESDGMIEFHKIEFVEMYHKNQKSDLDRERIRSYFGG